MATVRKASLADLSILLKLEKEFDRDQRRIVLAQNPHIRPCMRRTPNADRVVAKNMRKAIRSRNVVVFLATVADVPAGFCTVSIEKNTIWLPERFGHIGYLFVKRQYRRRGISNELVRAVVAWLRSRNLPHLSLGVMAYNKPARAIYDRWGFHDRAVFMWKVVRHDRKMRGDKLQI
jgi:ribosomal protein S18 acetylase RimI-like enzyme